MSTQLAARQRRRAEGVAAASGEGRVWPWWARVGSDMTVPASRSWTTLGSLSSPSRVTVDPRGMLTPDGTWSLEWWVGADGRWHIPGREASVRQQLVGSSPVVETAMRVPGGDVVATTYAVPGSGRVAAAAVVEVDNRSPAPVAVAFAIRPYNPTGIAPVERIDRRDDRTIAVDGRVGVLLPRAPARTVWSPFAAGDVLRLLEAELGAGDQRTLSCPDRLAQAAFVYPVPHRTSVRVVLPFGEGGSPGATAAASLPPAAAVARSWAAQARRGLQAGLPPGRLADAVEANRAFVVLAAGRDEGDRSARRRRNAALTTALRRWGFAPEAALVSTRSPGAGRATPEDLGSAVPALEAVGSGGRPAPDATARQMAELARREIAGADPRALDRLHRLLDTASPSWGWPTEPVAHGRVRWPGGGDDGWARACFLAAVGDLLVRELSPGPIGPPGLALCSVLPPEWVGQSIDVRDAPTRWGSVSFAVRWHGPRPALLWELAPAPGVGPVHLVAPGLDRSWSSGVPIGEALLAPIPAAPATS